MERFRGYGIMVLPFETGHVLGLRVFPETDHGPFTAVWHRTPSGRWSMYVDAPDPDVFCPRFFGPILGDSGRARISLDRPSSRHLRVRMDRPSLEWEVDLRSSPVTWLANRFLPWLPLGFYRTRGVLALVRAVASRALDLGPMDLTGSLPAGHSVLVQPHRLFLVRGSRAVWKGKELGRPIRAEENPVTGSFRWPARGVLAEGDLHLGTTPSPAGGSSPRVAPPPS